MKHSNDTKKKLWKSKIELSKKTKYEKLLIKLGKIPLDLVKISKIVNFGNPKYAPCPLLVNMVQAGKLGVKSGEGFYSYAGGYKNKEVSGQFKK